MTILMIIMTLCNSLVELKDALAYHTKMDTDVNDDVDDDDIYLTMITITMSIIMITKKELIR